LTDIFHHAVKENSI